MRILIDLTSLSYHMTGIERFAKCISLEMITQDTTNEYILLFRNEIYPDFSMYVDNERIKAKVIKGDHKLLFFQIVIPWNLYKIKADRYLFFAFPSPILFFNKHIYNTIHDMGRWDCPETKGLHLFYFKTTESIALKKARHIFTVSEFSKERIHSLMNIDSSRITVTYSAVAESITKSSVLFDDIKAKYNLPDKYILFLSTLQPRKNLKLLLEAYSEIKDKVDYSLVLIGRNGWNVDELITKYNAGDKIVFTGFVDDQDISAIYKNAMCFIWPTLYEGFGLPPIEALTMGCPVISSDCSCTKEILRNQAIYFSDNNKDELKELLVKLPFMSKDMPRKLDEFQTENYSFASSARTILETIN